MTTFARPDWVSAELYPFRSHVFETPSGRLHYIDEGRGRPLVFIHGNPSWSFEFRKLVTALSPAFRCIAVDHLGFGLSDKTIPVEERDPRRHAARLRNLLLHLDLQNVTLVMVDWGGPIGLDFAILHPERVAGLVLFNSFAWPVNGDLHFMLFSRVMASPPGQMWIRYFNGFVNSVLPTSVGVKSALTPQVMAHYRGPFATVADRAACAALPYYILGAKPWLQEIWDQREKFADTPALVVWGGSDIAFRDKEFAVWKQALRHGTFHFYQQAGHMVPEEIPDLTIGHIRDFLANVTLLEDV